MTRKKQRSDRQPAADRPTRAIFEEVDTFEEPRLQELSLTVPEGTKIYLRVRAKADRGTLH